MNVKKTIYCLVFSALLLSPQVASAGDINIQTQTTRVRVGTDSGINIQTRGRPLSGYNLWRRLPDSSRRNWNITRNYRHSQGSCRSNGYTYQSTQRIISGSSIAQTMSSSSTTVCQ